MLMKKRGQIGHVITYILIAFTAILLSLLGYKGFVMIKEKMCQTELADFEIDLRGLDEEVGFGSVLEKTFFAPCSVDEVYFVDLDKEVNLEVFNKLPIIKDSLQSGIEDNLFLVKDNEVKRSFFVGNLNIGYPYYKCLKPRNERINFFLEGAGGAVDIIPGCMQPECTYVPEVLDVDKADAIAASIKFREDSAECPVGDPGCEVVIDTVTGDPDIDTEVKKTIETMDNVEIFRKYQYCPDTGIAKVEIVIRPKEGRKVEEFRLFEYIPKECILDLQTYIDADDFSTQEESYVTVNIKEDPLIMWHFDVIEKEETVSYEIRKRLGDVNCKEVIDSIGIADLVGDAGQTLENVEDIVTSLTYTPPAEFTQPEIDNIADDVEGELVGAPAVVSPSNNEPTLSLNPSDASHSLTEGDSITINLIGNDVDGDTLTYSATGLPSGATLLGQTFSWTATSSDVSATPYSITFTVDDGQGGSDSKPVSITVPPSTSLELSISDVTLSSGASGTYTNVLSGSLAGGVSGGTPQYDFTILSQGDTNIVDCSIRLPSKVLDCDVLTDRQFTDGKSEIEIEVRDNSGDTDTDDFEITVPCYDNC